MNKHISSWAHETKQTSVFVGYLSRWSHGTQFQRVEDGNAKAIQPLGGEHLLSLQVGLLFYFLRQKIHIDVYTRYTYILYQKCHSLVTFNFPNIIDYLEIIKPYHKWFLSLCIKNMLVSVSVPWPLLSGLSVYS